MERTNVLLGLFLGVVLILVCGATQSQGQPASAELRASLDFTNTKTVASPPTGEANAVDDLTLIDNGDGTYSLGWSYVNVGDYNQDGTVNIADITPLAVHFNETATPENEWIDGNGDTVINISDITPLAAGFFSEVAEYAVETSDDEGVSWSELTRVAFGEAIQEPAGTRKRFDHLLTEPVEMALYRVVPYDSSGTAFGPESNPVRYTSQPPTLGLSEDTPTPPQGGDGSQDNPYLVEIDTPYTLEVTSGPGGTAITTELSFSTFPPAFLTISEESPFVLTVENELAGDFWVRAKWGDIAPIDTNRLYFRVAATLPP